MFTSILNMIILGRESHLDRVDASSIWLGYDHIWVDFMQPSAIRQVWGWQEAQLVAAGAQQFIIGHHGGRLHGEAATVDHRADNPGNRFSYSLSAEVSGEQTGRPRSQYFLKR